MNFDTAARKNSSDTFRKHLSQESARRKRSNSSPREDERHTPTGNHTIQSSLTQLKFLGEKKFCQLFFVQYKKRSEIFGSIAKAIKVEKVIVY